MAWSLRKALGVETRSLSPESIKSSATAEELLAYFGLKTGGLPSVTIDTALQVPAVAAAVHFLSSSLAALPLHAYRNKNDTPERVGGALQRMLNEAANPEWSSFGFRQYFWQQRFTGGRGLAYIERANGQPAALWPIDPTKVTPKRVGVRKVYEFKDGSTVKTYEASEIIDVPHLLKPDQLQHHSPITMGEKAIQAAIALNDYASSFFAGGGVPPLALEGPLPAGSEAMKRMMADVNRAIEGAKNASKPVFPMPPGYTLKPVGFDPEKGQMTDARRFQIEEIARLYNLPPVFLQDLTHGTFSNTEQQDLHLVKHKIAQEARAFEDELNLKLFGAENNRRWVEHSLDGLMRGALKDRIEALARGVQTALITPDEARALDNRPPMDGGDKLYIQGATIPLNASGQQDTGTPPPAQGGTNDDGA